MAKPKRSGSSGPKKNHGPKRHMFKEYKPMVWKFGKMGLLSKYRDEESFVLACQARGKKNVSHSDWLTFIGLKSKVEKDNYFKSLSEKK